MAKTNDVVPADLEHQLLGSLNLYSIKELESLLGFSRKYLRELASNAGGQYNPFQQYKKPRPFQKLQLSRKPRDIDNPSEPLKRVQRSININLLRPLDYPRYICGGVQGKSVSDNVEMHLGQRTLVTLDVRSFFPSISHHLVHRVWRNLLNCSPDISDLLTQLTTFERHLPQGAPTSTLLANLVLIALDAPIREKCKSEGVIYSTWVDDLAFSGDNSRLVIETAVLALREGGFAISHSKLRVMGPGKRKVLNGTVLGRFPTVEPKRLAWIRSGIHKLATNQIPEPDVPAYVHSLEGKINYVSQIVPAKGPKLLIALELARKRLLQTREFLRKE